MDTQLAIRLLDQMAIEQNRPLALDYAEYNIGAGETIELDATDATFIVDYVDEEIEVVSDKGTYYQRNPKLNLNQHVHTGLITARNRSDRPACFSFTIGRTT